MKETGLGAKGWSKGKSGGALRDGAEPDGVRRSYDATAPVLYSSSSQLFKYGSPRPNLLGRMPHFEKKPEHVQTSTTTEALGPNSQAL